MCFLCASSSGSGSCRTSRWRPGCSPASTARGAQAPAGARLSGRDRLATDAQFDLLEALDRYAQDRGLTMTDVAIGALLARPAVCSVIAGATKPDQVRSNASAARWNPSEEDLAALAELLGS